MSDVFISYSRKDKPFVQVLHQALAASYYEAWIDWEDIPLTADWWAEIEAGIEAADTFLFVISPDSIVSQICGQEIDHAVSHQKRLVPIVRRDGFDAATLHPALGKHNWLFFRETDDFDVAFAALVMALNTDLAYVKAHTRLLVKALDWERKQRRDDLLLRGEDLSEAERWLDQSLQTGHDPPPTEQHNIYIHKSREVETANQRIVEAGEQAHRLLHEAKVAARLHQESMYVLNQFATAPLNALLMAMEHGRELKALVRDRPLEEYPTTQPLVTLRTILDNIQEKNQLKAHDSSIWAMDVNPVQELVVTADEFGHIRLWNFAGQLQQEADLEPTLYARPQFSRDGCYLLMVSGRNQLQLWDVETWQPMITITSPQEQVSCVAILSSGKGWVSASLEGSLTLWNRDGAAIETVQITPKRQETLTGIGIQWGWNEIDGATEITSILGNSPAQREGLAVGDKILQINNISIEKSNFAKVDSLFSTDTVILKVARKDSHFKVTLIEETFTTEYPSPVKAIKISPTDAWIAIGCGDGKVRFYTLAKTPIPPEIVAFPETVTDLAVSSDSMTLATVGKDPAVKLWDLSTGKLTVSLEGHKASGQSVSFSSDGYQIATSSGTGESNLWSLDGKLIISLKGHSYPVTKISFAHQNNLIVTAGWDGTLRFWKLSWNKESRLIVPDFFNAVLDTDGKRLAITETQGGASIWSLSGEHLAQLDCQNYSARLLGISFSKDGRTIAATSTKGKIFLWNSDGKEILHFSGDSRAISYINFSPDGQMLLTASTQPIARIWNLQGQLLAQLEGHTDALWICCFSPDGDHILTGSNDGTARLWTIHGELVTTFQVTVGVVLAVAFSPDGKKIAVGGADGIVRLWELNGAPLQQLRGHQREVVTIHFSPDGCYLVTTSFDKTARIWNLEGQQIAEFRDVKGGGGFAQFSPDGQQVILIGQHNQVHIVPFSPASLDELLQRGCDWLADYLTHSPSATEAQRALCPGIGVEGTEQ